MGCLGLVALILKYSSRLWWVVFRKVNTECGRKLLENFVRTAILCITGGAAIV